MSALDQLAENDQVSKAIYDAIALRPRKTARTGFTNICCAMCVSRGETQDRKFRCGIIQGDGIGVNCYNCGFRAKWRLGERLSKNMKDLLLALGMTARQVQQAAYWADQMRSMLGERPDVQAKHNISVSLDFPTVDLPPQARSIQDLINTDCDHPDFLRAIDYLLSRGDVAATATTYYWSPEPDLCNRLIIPCYHRNNIVGWIARSILPDDKLRYMKQLPSNYLFNSGVMTIPERKYVLICEGSFDALVIDGVGALGASLNDTQLAWIAACGKQPVIVPDRDKAGGQLVEIAIKREWPVAFPHYGNKIGVWWDADVKDPDEAVKRYGKLYTIQSILSSLTWNKAEIRSRMSYRVD